MGDLDHIPDERIYQALLQSGFTFEQLREGDASHGAPCGWKAIHAQGGLQYTSAYTELPKAMRDIAEQANAQGAGLVLAMQELLRFLKESGIMERFIQTQQYREKYRNN